MCAECVESPLFGFKVWMVKLSFAPDWIYSDHDQPPFKAICSVSDLFIYHMYLLACSRVFPFPCVLLFCCREVQSTDEPHS